MSDYVLLPKQPQELPEIHLLTLEEFRQRRDMIESFQSGEVGMDYESNGYDPKKPDFEIRTVGLANDEYCVSIDLLGAKETDLQTFKKWISGLKYAAHNVMFEAAATQAFTGSVGNPVADTYILFADLATEYRRSWSLDTAMGDLLGLEKEGDKVKEHMKANKWTWADINKFDFEILGRYNAIDAFGHWELYKYFQRIIESYQETWGAYYWDYHRQDCLTAVLLEVEARDEGIYIDTPELEASYEDLTPGRDRALSEFINNKDISSHIEDFNRAYIAEVEAARPPAFTKTGKVTARFRKWQDKLTKAKEGMHFNTNSTAQLRWLFFDMMKLPVVEYTEKGEPSTSKEVLKKLGIPGKLLLDYREYVNKLKFVVQIREGLTYEDNIIRPFVRPFATLTTRSGGGRLE